MIAVDTNVLIYGYVSTFPQHADAKRILRELSEAPTPWAIAWPCVYEFLRVVTHPRVLQPPMPMDLALENFEILCRSPGLTLLAQTNRHLPIFRHLVRESKVTGNLVFDAHIAALCLEHGVSEIVTFDRDFLRFSRLKTRLL